MEGGIYFLTFMEFLDRLERYMVGFRLLISETGSRTFAGCQLPTRRRVTGTWVFFLVFEVRYHKFSRLRVGQVGGR
jgi:hypothetical protein